MALNSFDVRAGTATLPNVGDAVTLPGGQGTFHCPNDGTALVAGRYAEEPNLLSIWFRCPTCTAGFVSLLHADGTLAPSGVGS